jgi:hypothetical protein
VLVSPLYLLTTPSRGNHCAATLDSRDDVTQRTGTWESGIRSRYDSEGHKRVEQ